MSDMLITMCVIAYNEEQNINGILAVSYTHLTLPTIA